MDTADLVTARESSKGGASNMQKAKRALTSFGTEVRVARRALKTAEGKLARFKRGPLATFRKLRDRVLPPTSRSGAKEQIINILERIRILPHSVLGSQLGRDRRVVQHEEPDGSTAFVDPAGLHHIQPPGGPAGAGGAARAI